MKKSCLQPMLTTLIHQRPNLVMLGTIVLTMGIQALFTFCGTISCPAFDNQDYDTWLPYTQNQTAVFTNGIYTDTLTIGYAYQSEAEDIKQGYGSRRCYVHAEMYGNFASSGTANGSSFRVFSQVEGKVVNGFLDIKGLRIHFTNISDTGLTIDPIQAGSNGINIMSKFQPTIQISGRNFTQVQAFETDPASATKTGIRRMWLARQEGIVAFEPAGSATIWVKQ